MRVRIARAGMFGTAAIAALISVPAFAQDAVPPSDTPSETAQVVAAQNEAVTRDEPAEASDQEIIVTARRRDEVLLDVPIAVTAYSGEQLNRQGALDITDIADTTPNVTLEPSRGTNSTLTAFIRGVGQQDPVAGFEQGVGIYLDDVYLNRPQAAVLDIYDVERVEILRGPQGTLYGRNTVGGAVKYVTRRLPDRPEIRARANLGTYKQADLIVSASTPLGSENFRVGVAGARLSRGGFGKNITTGKDNYNKDVWALRGTAEADAGPLSLRLSGDYTWDNSNTRGGHRLIPALFHGDLPLGDVYDSAGNLLDPKQKVKGGGWALHGDVQLTDWLKFRSITAFRKDRSDTPIDFDALPYADFDVPAIYKNKQFSQEAQLLIERGPLSGLIGAYYLDADASTLFDVRVYQLIDGLAAITDSKIGTKTTAVFADFTYDLSEQFSVSVGGRYTWDKRRGDIFRQRYLGGGSAEFGGLEIPFLGVQTDFEGEAKFKKFTPRASVSFKPNADNTLYASYSQGFKGGGFDPRSSTLNAPDLNNDGTISPDEIADYVGFDPETVDSYEIGYKASLFDRRLNLAIAAFHAKYDDVQIPGSVPCISGGAPSFCGVVDNAGKARMNGLEVETSGAFTRDLTGAGDRLGFAATLGYIDAKYTKFISNILVGGVNTPVDVSDYRKFQNTPKWTWSGTLDYQRPLASGKLYADTTVTYRSKVSQFEIPGPYDQKGFALWDANLVWRSAGARYELGVHAKNITNKKYITSGYNFLTTDPVTGALVKNAAGNYTPGAGLGLEGVLTAFYGNPRQVWLSAAVNF